MQVHDGKFCHFAVFPRCFQARADGNVLARKDMIDAISPGEGPISTRAIDILVSRIRKKVGKDVILTVPNAGYKCG